MCVNMYIHVYIYIYMCMYMYAYLSIYVARRIRWPLHDNVITNIVWCMANKGRVGGGAYNAQWACNSIAIG